ncbi:hypothetical protein K8S19_09205 [bacterium]|nr:hypothetical protein [bacterium]
MKLKKNITRLAITLGLFMTMAGSGQAVTTTAMGVIWDESNNTPCAFSWIWVDNSPNSVYADEQGRYVIENFDCYELKTSTDIGVTRTGYADYCRYKPIEPGKVNTINASVYIGSLMSGVVTSLETGSPVVEGATVSAYVTSQTLRALTQADGSYQMRFEPGNYDYRVEKESVFLNRARFKKMLEI